MFEEKMNSLLEEGFGTSSVMNVNELRMLYYGRMNLYASFSNDADVEFELMPDKDRPSGMVAHTIADIVGRKVKTSSFYAHVFRVKKTGSLKFIDNIKTYDTSSLKKDINMLMKYPKLDEETLLDIMEKATNNMSLRSPFQRLWHMTREIAKAQNNSQYKIAWRLIFTYLGYSGIGDPNGTGLLNGGTRHPASIIFTRDVENLDIVPIQKFRKDERNRVKYDVHRAVAKMTVARKRVAKKELPSYRRPTKSSGIKQIIGALYALSV
ncbi:hypothetical protein [Alishewanella phage vB_AspM_Slicko01]|nr:hypothetical protein [Alishewanella phage vB_AspM_Slicko01]